MAEVGRTWDLLTVELGKLGHLDVDPRFMDDEQRIEFIRTMAFACEDEIHEALAEVGWKPWATSRHVNRNAFLKELVDAQLFLDNLMLAVLHEGESVHDLQREVDKLILERIERTLQRQRDGYDGVTGKCPQCHVDLGDKPVTEVDGVQHCGGCGAYLGSVPPPRDLETV